MRRKWHHAAFWARGRGGIFTRIGSSVMGYSSFCCRKARLCNRWRRREECHLRIKLKHLGQEREVIYF